MIYGNPNDHLLTPEEHERASVRMGADCLRAVGIDPNTKTPAQLRDYAMTFAGIIGRYYAGPGLVAAAWELIKAEHLNAAPCASDRWAA